MALRDELLMNEWLERAALDDLKYNMRAQRSTLQSQERDLGRHDAHLEAIEQVLDEGTESIGSTFLSNDLTNITTNLVRAIERAAKIDVALANYEFAKKRHAEFREGLTQEQWDEIARDIAEHDAVMLEARERAQAEQARLAKNRERAKARREAKAGLR